MFFIPIKTDNEIQIMREAGKILGNILQHLKDMSKPGLDSWELEEEFLRLCEKNNVTPACKGYAPHGFPPFPVGLCFNIDDEVVHNQPRKGLVLAEGQLITLDTVIEYKGYFVDSAISYGIGTIESNKQKLLDITENAMYEAIKLIKPGIRIGDMSNKIETTAKNAGFSVLTEYAGHGIGKRMHEPPEIPCYGQKNKGPTLKKGMTLAIEPLICEKSSKISHSNFWDTKTDDGGNFAQFEHTVLVTNSGYEILTKK